MPSKFARVSEESVDQAPGTPYDDPGTPRGRRFEEPDCTPGTPYDDQDRGEEDGTPYDETGAPSDEDCDYQEALDLMIRSGYAEDFEDHPIAPAHVDPFGAPRDREETAREKLKRTAKGYFECTVCNDFTAKSLLVAKQHMRTHFPAMAGKGASCTICGFLFTRTDNFSRHMKLHEIGVECPQCTTHFPDRATMRQHVKEVHTPTSAMACPHCAFVTTSREYLRVHLQSHDHAGGKIELRCDICDKVFAARTSLVRHMARHLGRQQTAITARRPEPVQCRFCTFLGRDAYNTRRHEKAVHASTPFKCEACGRSFSGPAKLARHVANPKFCVRACGGSKYKHQK
jgi:uncharacterized C2H2 Zn-finger protein